MLSPGQGHVSVRLARQSIEEHLGLQVTAPVSTEELTSPFFLQQCGVFVTIYKQGALRGCIGSLTSKEPVREGIRRQAVNSALYDHRFNPVREEELADLQIEVSVLSVPEELNYTDADELVELLRPGIDGVIIASPAGKSATFLPQVWKQLPEPVAFLKHLCRKAGLADNFWKKGQLSVKTYTVQCFEE